MQVLAAQWVHDAVIAYNSLIEHVCTLPLQTPQPGDLSNIPVCITPRCLMHSAGHGASLDAALSAAPGWERCISISLPCDDHCKAPDRHTLLSWW